MWQVDGRELLLLKGGGGERFAAFVDGLIRAEAAAHGLRQSEIDTQVRGNISDGGVDTRVRAAVPGDESGWLSVPTCWQYKAQEAADIADKDLREEIKKPEVVRLMNDGHAFRLCIVCEPWRV